LVLLYYIAYIDDARSDTNKIQKKAMKHRNFKIILNNLVLLRRQHVIITDYTGQQISNFFFVSVMIMLLMYVFASMKLEKGHKKLLGSSFKIMLPL
jgi:hypothetical protein